MVLSSVRKATDPKFLCRLDWKSVTLNWYILRHPLQSDYLAYSDYNLIRSLQNVLDAKTFKCLEKKIQYTSSPRKLLNFWWEGFIKLFQRSRKLLEKILAIQLNKSMFKYLHIFYDIHKKYKNNCQQCCRKQDIQSDAHSSFTNTGYALLQSSNKYSLYRRIGV